MDIHVGVTGSRTGWNSSQADVFSFLLDRYNDVDNKWFHHGDCVGVDDISAGLAVSKGWKEHVYPPISKKLAANRKGNIVEAPQDYLVRNRNIVNNIDLLIGVPSSKVKKGGTWYTINYAKTQNKEVLVLLPDIKIEDYIVTQPQLFDI